MAYDFENVIPRSADLPHVRNRDIATLPNPDVRHVTTVIAEILVGQDLGHIVPVARGEVREQSVVNSACGVLQLRRGLAQFVEPGDRGIEICLVEKFGAVDQIAFSRDDFQNSPLGVETLLRGPFSNLSENRSKIVEPVHSLDVGAELLLEIPTGTDVCGHVPGRESDSAPVVEVHPVRRRRR